MKLITADNHTYDNYNTNEHINNGLIIHNQGNGDNDNDHRVMKIMLILTTMAALMVTQNECVMYACAGLEQVPNQEAPPLGSPT